MRVLIALLFLTSCTAQGTLTANPSPSPSSTLSPPPASAAPALSVGAVTSAERAQQAVLCMRSAGQNNEATAVESLISIYNNRKASLGESVAAQAYLTGAASAINQYNTSHDPDC
jgi:uncharacterized lipoprotein YajG